MAAESSSARKTVEDLDLPPQVVDSLKSIQAELMALYSEQFVAMVNALNTQASALQRIQSTLEIVLSHLHVKLPDGKLPVAFQVAPTEQEADLAKAVVVADPVGMGFRLTQSDIGKALNVPQPDLSILFKAFKLADDERCAVTVRRGKGAKMVNYNDKAISLFIEKVKSPPTGLDRTAAQALRRVRAKLKARLDTL